MEELDPYLARRAIDAVEAGVLIADATVRGFPIVWASPSFERMTGFAKADMLGKHCSVLQGEGSDPAAVQAMSVALAAGEPCRVTLLNYRKNGSTFWNEVSLAPVRNGDGEITHITGIQYDVTEAVEADERAKHLATHDSLTGLPNRSLAADRLEQMLGRIPRHTGAITVMFIDLDGLKAVNDAHGHQFGDEILKQTPERIRHVVRDEDTIARWGGDEVILLCPEFRSEAGIAQLAQRILKEFEEPFDVGAEQARMSVSIGISIATSSAADPAVILHEADSAMYRAKAAGGGTFEFFDEEMRSRFERRGRLFRDLRASIGSADHSVVYQPMVDIATREVVGVEALARWTHPIDGPIAPDEFIGLAEETGMIVELGRNILGQAVEEFTTAEIDEGIGLSVNLSSRQLTDRGLVGFVAETLEKAGLAPERLSLEITETTITSDLQSAAARLWELKEMGISIHLDDFGAGFASLGHLRKFPIDTIKIDRTFISGLGIPSQDATIVTAIIPMARALGLRVIAEGVETDRQLAHLASLGFRFAQGFFFARPEPIAGVANTVSAGAIRFSELTNDATIDSLRSEYQSALRTGSLDGALTAVRKAISLGVDGTVLQTQVIAPALRWIGEQWEGGRISVADEHLATSITERALGEIFAQGRPGSGDYVGTAVLAGAQGEHHVLGLRMTADLLYAAGFEPIYLGADVPGEALIDTVRDRQPDAVCITASMPENVWGLADLVKDVKAVKPDIEVVVGGIGSFPDELTAAGAVEATSPEDAVRVITGSGD